MDLGRTIYIDPIGLDNLADLVYKQIELSKTIEKTTTNAKSHSFGLGLRFFGKLFGVNQSAERSASISNRESISIANSNVSLIRSLTRSLQSLDKILCVDRVRTLTTTPESSLRDFIYAKLPFTLLPGTTTHTNLDNFRTTNYLVLSVATGDASLGKGFWNEITLTAGLGKSTLTTEGENSFYDRGHLAGFLRQAEESRLILTVFGKLDSGSNALNIKPYWILAH